MIRQAPLTVAGAAAGADGCVPTTSAATIAPPGPEPWIRSRSIACSAAIRRAFGEARRGRRCGEAAMGAACGTGVAAGSGAGCRGWGGSVGCSPAASTTAITSPTGTWSPSPARTPERVPSIGDSSSTVALSVSTSSSASPADTWSPSARSQRSTMPESWAMPSAGMITSAGIAYAPDPVAVAGLWATSSPTVAAIASGVGTVSSSSGGENGIGTSRAPSRRTGASRW